MYAIQDGPDFYLFKNETDDDPTEVVNSPFSFKDGDVEEARKARDWFKRERPDVEVR